MQEACRLIRDIASALALLHARRVVHRDVSPNNVRFTAEGRAKLLDFGALTSFGAPSDVVGTPPFVAPECLARAPLDQRADVYALGALAYWTLTRHTHVGARTLEALQAAWSEPLAPPSRYVAELPRALDELVLSMLSVERDGRPGAMADVIERLTTWVNLPPEGDESRVAQSYLQHPPLIAREQPIADFQYALRGALSGSGTILLAEAARGLGRSALLDRFATDAQLAGATVLRASGGASAKPFAVARRLVHTAVASFPDIGASGPSLTNSVLTLLPGEPAPQSRSLTEASQQQARIAGALATALLQVSLRAPLVLLVDDAHVADEESISLLASLAETLRRHSILLVLSVDSAAAFEGDAPAKLAAWAKRIQLGPLSELALTELVTTVFGAVPNAQRLAAWLHGQTGGNPAETMDRARLLIARGAIRYTVGTFTLPHTFDASDASSEGKTGTARLVGSAEAVRELAHALALHPGTLTPSELAHVTGSSIRDVTLGLEELARRNAVVLPEDGASCASESMRRDLCDGLATDHARALHSAIARTLTELRGRSYESRLAAAGHLLRAGGDEALAGASELAELGRAYPFQVAMNAAVLPSYESALGLLGSRGFSDEECIGLLAPLSVAGFYGSMELQSRYLDRTLGALSAMCGLTWARRWAPYVGATLALYLGMTCAFWVQLFTRRRLNHSSYVESLQALLNLIGPATAAAASAYDTAESYRIVGTIDVFAKAPRTSGLYAMYQFGLATAELIAGKGQSAAERYRVLLALFARPVAGMDAELRKQASLGCLHGLAQALVTDTSPAALEHAQELERLGPFYHPHVECVRMTYHAYRGESQRAAVHRTRCESLAFQGGTSWSAIASLAGRSVISAVLTGDVIALVHIASDLARLARTSTSLASMHALAEAHLELLRGHADRAIRVYEQELARDEAKQLCNYAFHASMYAQALSAVGQHARAKQVCEGLIARFEDAHGEIELEHRLPRQRLALAEAALGNLARATELLDACFERASLHDNPLALGSLHRDRAYVAGLARDDASCVAHFEAMRRHFLATKNPWLIQQCDALRVQLVKLGVEALAALPGGHALTDAQAEFDADTVIEADAGLGLQTEVDEVLPGRAARG